MINDLDIVQWAYLLDPAFQLVNSAGKPLTDGWIEVYIHGTRNKYYCASDFDGTLHPFKIPLDSLGANIVLASPDYAYDIYIYNKFGSLVMSRYNVVAGKGGGGSGGIPSSTEAQHWLGQYGATQPLEGNERGQTLALPSRPDYQGDFVDHIDYGLINGDEVNQYPKYMYLKPGLYLVNCVIRFQQQSGTEVNRLDETLVYTGNGNANEDIAWQLDETGPLATGDRHCLKLTFIRKVLDEGETSTVDCNDILYFAPAPSVNWSDAYIQTLQVVKLNSAVQGGGGAGSIYKPGEGISIDEENVISVTGMQPASGMSDYVTINVFNEFVENVTGDINILQNEIDAVSAAVSGGVAPEYEAGYGIIIEDNTISVDPTVMPSGCVSQDELAQVSGDIVNQISNVTGDVTEITNIVNNVTGDVTNLTEVVNNVTGDVTNLTEIVEGVTGDVTNIITEISNVTGDIVNINENVTNLTEVVNNVTGDITNLTEVVNNVTGDVTNLTEVVNNVTGDVQNLTTIVENVTGDINNLETIVNNVTGDINVLETNISNVSGDVINLTEVVEGVTGDITNLTEVVNNVTGDITNLTEVVNNVTGDVSNLTEIVNGVTGDIEQLESDIQAVSAAIPPAQVQSDWAQEDDSQVDYIKNKPEETDVVAGPGISIVESGSTVTISTVGVATSGDVADLESQIQTVSAAIPTDVVTHPELAAVTGDVENITNIINNVTGDIQTVSGAIPTDVVTHEELAAVTGDYATNEDLQIVSGAIPTDVVTHAELAGVTGDYATNTDLQYVSGAVDEVSGKIPESEEVEFEELDLSKFVTETAVTGLEAEIQTVSAAIPEAQVNSDWAATGGVAEILNKPEELPLIAGLHINITETASGIVISSTGGSVTGDYATHAELAQVAADVQAVSAAIPDVSDFVTHSELEDYATNEDLQTVSAAIPDISNLATESEVQFVSGAIEAVSAGIPAAQVQSDWTQTATGEPDYIKHKPTETPLIAGNNITFTQSASGLIISSEGGSVTGDYATHAELSQVETDVQTVSAAVDAVSAEIPASEEVEFEELDISQFVTESAVTGLEAEIQTVSAAIPEAQVNSDWNAVSGKAEILNKPSESNLLAGAGITIAASGDDFVISAEGGGSSYTAGQYISIENNEIAVTGLQPEGDYATNTALQTVSAKVDEVSGSIPESEEVEFEELDLSQYVTESAVTGLEAEIQTVSAAIPDTSNFATEAELQTVSGAIPDVSSLATKTELQTVSGAVDSVSASIPSSEEVTFEELDVSTFATDTDVSAAVSGLQNKLTGITDVVVTNSLPASPVATVLYLIPEA